MHFQPITLLANILAAASLALAFPHAFPQAGCGRPGEPKCTPSVDPPPKCLNPPRCGGG
ncbi:hypothetical protein EJ03DRAFT_5400 [Teratosphaeria nubilosa]|uniref:Uncharacterized protein n=1 Tax=Teratosphaeria nubilosa TaxID=161662 RepID=A0A6G1LN00_9PEZI|nr:hypothetical protein EJ03DRAFT_5400 [Teratosphaeria nubilosa]